MLFKNKIASKVHDKEMYKAIKKPKRKLSIRSKYLITLLLLTLLSVITISYISWYNAKESLTKSSYDQLTTLRNMRVQAIQEFFADNKAHLKILAENDTVINAMNEFNVAYDLLDLYGTSVDNRQRKSIDDYYESKFYPSLRAGKNVVNDLHKRIALNETASYLQYHYIVNNDNSQKNHLIKADDKSYYSEIHGTYHERLRLIADELHLRDLFLINKDSGNIVYSMAKNVDFSTSLLNGAYVDSGLAKAVRALMKTPDRQLIIIQDLQPYMPTYNAPKAFMVIPIYKNNNYVGILGAQLSMEEVNAIMIHDEKWLADGLGNSGEVYVLADDLSMRSDSRLLIENKAEFLEKLRNNGENTNVVKKIDDFNTTIFYKTINTPSAKAALKGETGYKEINNYYGLKVLSTYAPIDVKGINWIVLAEKSLEEVEQPIVDLQLIIMLSTVILIIFVSMFSLLYSNFFLQPIYNMVIASRKFIDKGEFSQVKIKSSDELGTLTYYFNRLITHARDQYNELKSENQKRRRLMLNFFPKNVVEKMERGETNIAHKHDNVALLFASFRGLNELINDSKQEEKRLEELSKLFNSFDEMAKRYEVDKLTLFGDNYVATCGLHKPRIDYARRCVHFALELFDLVQRFNQEQDVNLRLRVGINSGSVTAGIMGKEHFTYGLWGDTISIANRIRYDAHANALRITQNVYEQLTIKENFEKCPSIYLDTIGKIITWEYRAQCDENGVCRISLPTQSDDSKPKVKEYV